MSVPKNEAVVRAAKKAFKESTTARWIKLSYERAKWSRRLKISDTKFRDANNAMAELALELAREKDGAA